jgi:hypothetical protein
MYELKKIGKVFTSKFVGPGPSSYKKIIYWAAVSQRLRNIDLHNTQQTSIHSINQPHTYALDRRVTEIGCVIFVSTI